MKLLRVAILFFILGLATARAENTNSLPTTITIDKDTYEDVQWGRVTAYAVGIRHKSGIATIPLVKLPPELRARFQFDPKKAAAERAQELSAQQQLQKADADAVAKQKAQAEADAKAAAADEAARKAKEAESAPPPPPPRRSSSY